MTFPVYVPSKGRPDSSTLCLLSAADVPYCVVVEPQDFSSYAKNWPKELILELPENDQGLSFVRQFILEHARKRGLGWFWLLDDDLKLLGRVVSKKVERITAKEALVGAEAMFAKSEGLGQVGLEYQQFAWSATKPYVLNSYCDVAVAIHATRTQEAGVNFRNTFELKVDRDFTLQVITSGLSTARISRFCFGAPTNGSNAGGLKETYAKAGKEAAEARVLMELWPGICEVQTKKNGRVDAKINWRAAAKLSARAIE